MSGSLELLCGTPIKISDSITMKHPKVSDIMEYGEERYWCLAQRLTATSYDMMVELYDAGIDYEDMSDYDLFLTLFSAIKQDEYDVFFEGIKADTLAVATNNQNGELVVINKEEQIVVFDKLIHQKVVDMLREMHGFKRNYKIAGNKFTKDFYIRDARYRRDFELAHPKPFKSYLASMISSLVNTPGFKYNYETIRQVSIYQIMDAIKRTQAIYTYNHIMSGMYSGFMDAKKINSNDLNWMREL